MHELVHVRSDRLSGGLNLLIGIALLTLSFMYDVRTTYGMVRDPEYLPLASMKPLALTLATAARLETRSMMPANHYELNQRRIMWASSLKTAGL